MSEKLKPTRKAETLLEILSQYSKPKILEIGCIRETAEPYVEGDGYSTYFFADHVKENGGYFASVDVSTAVAQEVLGKHDLLEFVEFLEVDGGTYLKKMVAFTPDRLFDYIYLDGENDPQLTMEYFLTAINLVKQEGVIVLDDCDLTDPNQLKGRLVVPHLKTLAIPFEQKGSIIFVYAKNIPSLQPVTGSPKLDEGEPETTSDDLGSGERGSQPEDIGDGVQSI